MQIYVVQAGDTVTGIAAGYGVSADTVIYDNQLVSPYALTIGQALLINDGSSVESEPRRPLFANGYAYTFISPWVLGQTLPFLSMLSVFSYGFTTEGELLPPLLDDVWMIREAERYSVGSILTLTPFGPDGNFSNYLISVLVNNQTIQERLLSQMVVTMQEKGFVGVDIDFEFILADDRDAFTAFVERVVNIMNPLGYEVSVALAPKTSADQPGLLYEGKDYAALGAIANHVLLMTYEWGYTYGPPMAVAPTDMVRKVVEYAITEIPAAKINLGIPNYGYDWPLPFERGVTRARTIGNIEAVQMAISKGVPIQFDELAMSPFFHYEENGIEHEVWFEDVRSMRATFELIKEYNLRGAGYWQIMQLFRANWLLLNDTFDIQKML